MTGSLHLLTPRELTVLSYVAHGLPYVEISRALLIGERTVRQTMYNVCIKLDVHSRIQASLCAWRSGLVDPAEAWGRVLERQGLVEIEPGVLSPVATVIAHLLTQQPSALKELVEAGYWSN